MNRSSLTRFAWLSIAAALATIGLKATAYLLTGSVGLLSDAIESLVNLVGASVALTVLTVAAKPPDEEHLYGHSKAEYFSSGVEGGLILVAAISIAVVAVQRFITPQPVQQASIGLAVSTVASLVNFGVARILLQAGKQHNSITLEADARHLMTDVWTSIGVIGGVALVAITGWQQLDPIVALAVAANIVWTGFNLVRRSVLGLMDTALPAEEQAVVQRILDKYSDKGIHFHALRTRAAGSRRFISMHVLVPDNWTVRHGHQVVEKIEAAIRAALPEVTVLTHLEPLNDPASLADVGIDRVEAPHPTPTKHANGR
ncbi:MAG: cation transporter [Chloroflexi bacterium]|nr:cation transporter [Chloroflexota bacterium]